MHNSFSDTHFDPFPQSGLQSLLPIRLPSSEDMVDVLSCYGRSFDGTYKNALKHLQLAFESPAPVSEAALLPMIQVNIFFLFEIMRYFMILDSL